MKHKHPDVREREFVHAALMLAQQHGYATVTREQIAKRCKVSSALVSYHMGSMFDVRRRLIRQAIVQRVLCVIGQAIAAGDPEVRDLPAKLRKDALAALP